MSRRFISTLVCVTLAAAMGFAQQSGGSGAGQSGQSGAGQAGAPAQPDATAPAQPQSAPAQQPAAQQPTTSDQQVEPMDQTPVFRVNVVQRTTKAIDYRDRGGTTQVDFKGTDLAPTVEGWAKVTGRAGRLSIDANLHHLPQPGAVGPQYLSYVLWAITPEGRSVNLGEVMPDDKGNARLQVTSPLQVFGLIVTAEPYFAVTRPGDKVVAENIIRSDTQGWERAIDAKYEAIQSNQYTAGLTADQLPAAQGDRTLPLQMQEAENAIAIARAAGAEQYASDTLAKAQADYAKAQDYLARKQGNTPIGTVARAATQEAEDARLITLQKKQQEQADAERNALEQKAQNAQTQAEAEAARAQEARLNAQREAEQRALADQERQAAEQARQQAEQARLEAQQQAQQAQQQAQQAQQQAQVAEASQQAAEARAQQAEQESQRIQQQAAEQRARLLKQLNTVLQTKDTAKGLIVNMSDVLFDLGKATLKPDTQLRLAKLAGIILAYPDLKLQINGYTDSTGSGRVNQVLSEKRAASVRDFLISQGVDVGNVFAQGYGPADPVADNTTAAGRRQNRRVEIVLSGTAIGELSGTDAAAATQNATPAATAPPKPQTNQTIPH